MNDQLAADPQVMCQVPVTIMHGHRPELQAQRLKNAEAEKRCVLNETRIRAGDAEFSVGKVFGELHQISSLPAGALFALRY